MIELSENLVPPRSKARTAVLAMPRAIVVSARGDAGTATNSLAKDFEALRAQALTVGSCDLCDCDRHRVLRGSAFRRR